MEEVKLTLSIDEVNTIIEALGKSPFVDVYKIIEKIHLQADKQLKGSTNNNG